MADKKFVKIGAKNLRFAQLDDEGFVKGDILHLPGTTEIDVSVTSDNATINADDGPYMTLSSGISKITAKVSNYFLTPEAKTMLLGTKYTKGMEFYGDDSLPNHVAMMFETQLQSNEAHPLYVGLLNGTFKFPDNKNKTKGSGAPDPAAEEIEGEFVMQERGNGKTAEVNGFTSDPDFNMETYEALVFPKDQTSLDAALKKVFDATTSSVHTA